MSIKYSTLLLGVSELSCKTAFKNNEYKVLYNSYDANKFNLVNKSKLSDDELVISHVASFNDNKNQLFSLEVLKELKQLHPNAKLNLVGAADIDPYYQRLIDFLKTNNLEDSVSFVEKTNNVEKIYEKTTFAILPSFSEGLPLTVIEAQACGMIVFASTNVTKEVDCGGVRFLELSKGSTCWADVIHNEFIKQGNCRRKYQIEKFSFDKFKESLIDLYN